MAEKKITQKTIQAKQADSERAFCALADRKSKYGFLSSWIGKEWFDPSKNKWEKFMKQLVDEMHAGNRQKCWQKKVWFDWIPRF